MTCSEIREYLFAFLDNELDTPPSIEIQLHIEQCPVCAREVEIERAIKERLVRATRVQSPETPLDIHKLKRIIEKGQTSDTLHRILSRRGILAACAAIVFAAGLVAHLVMQDASITREGHPKFVRQVVSDFEHFQEEGQQIHFASSNAHAVSDWLLRQTDLEVVVPNVKGLYCKLVGARKCTIEDQPAAFVVYEMTGVPASLVAIAGRNSELEQMRQIEHNGQTHWVDDCDGFSVVAYRKDNLVYAMVSKLSQQELIHFLSEAADESN
jgi:anti-sigma factor RsiW